MESVKNSAGKTICKVDAKGKQLEILHKGVRTLIRFLPDGTVKTKDIDYKQM